MLVKRWCFLIFFSISIGITSSCFCKQKTYDHLAKYPDIKYIPWFSGPLLSPTPVNMLPGHPAIEPSMTIGSTYGKYNDHWKFKGQVNEWFINPLLDFQLGFTKRIGLEIIASCISNFKRGVSSTRMQDSILLLGFQIADDVKGSWIPDIRIDLQETLPTGSYQKFNPKKLGTDSTGQGSFQTGPVLIVQKLFFPGDHFLSCKISVGYLFPSTVKVKGLNAYGGNSKTNGKVSPGQTLITFLSAEYSISQRWGCGFDALFISQSKATFSGNPGTERNRNQGSVGLPPSLQFSLAPFFEYNFSSKMGILGGTWFTVAGRNTSAFLSGYLAFLYGF